MNAYLIALGAWITPALCWLLGSGPEEMSAAVFGASCVSIGFTVTQLIQDGLRWAVERSVK